MKNKTGKIRKIFWTLICGFFATSLISLNAGAVDDIDPYTPGGDLSLGRCLAKGNTDFILFLNAVINFDGLFEGVMEPIWDVTTRNQCQGTDIYGLIKQRDKVRGQIRDAFLTCNTQKLPSMERAYHELNAEIYYARHIVNGLYMASLPFDLLSTRMLEAKFRDNIYTPESQLKKEMQAKYVDSGKFTREDFEIFFNSLVDQYDERKYDYVICDNTSWNVVSEKWEEFIDTAAGMGPAVENFGDRVGGGAEKIAEAFTEPGLVDYLAGIVALNISDLEPEAGVSEIFDRLQENLPSMVTPTQQTIFEALLSEEDRYDTDVMRATMEAQFRAAYKDGSDSVLSLFLTELEDLNKTIEETFKPMDKVVSCTTKMNFRMCPGG